MPLLADVGDPQIRTDHPWYPGELAISNFERLFATQAATCQRVRGDEPEDFWSQSFCYGSCKLKSERGKPIQIRFSNDGGKRYLRVGAHLENNNL